MNGTVNRTWCLVVFVVGCFYFAFAAFPAVANEVSTRINLSHYHEVSTQTTRVPNNASVSPVRDITPSVSARPGGGLTQTMPGSITINSVKTSPPAGQTLSGPMLTTLNVGKGAMQAAMFACMRHVVCRAGSVAIPVGVDLALDQFGASVEDGQVVMPGEIDPSNAADFVTPENSDDCCFRNSRGSTRYPSAALACAVYGSYNVPVSDGSTTNGGTCRNENNVALGGAWWRRMETPICPAGSVSTDYGCVRSDVVAPQPVTDDVLQQIADGYEPMPEDWNYLADSIAMGAPDVTVEVLDIPSLTGADSPNFIQNADGSSTSTYSEYEFIVRGNDSKQPIIDVEETTVVTEYDATGAITDTSTSTSSQAGSGAGAPVNLEVPTDCAFFPTACRFFDWVMSPFDEPEPVLPPVSEFEDIGRDVEIGPSSGTCPAPYVIDFSFVPSVEISYEPFCDLGGIMRSLLLAIAAFIGGYLVVRSL